MTFDLFLEPPDFYWIAALHAAAMDKGIACLAIEAVALCRRLHPAAGARKTTGIRRQGRSGFKRAGRPFFPGGRRLFTFAPSISCVGPTATPFSLSPSALRPIHGWKRIRPKLAGSFAPVAMTVTGGIDVI